MLIVVPHHEGDRERADRVIKLAARISGTRHRIMPLFCPPHGVLREWGFCVRPGLAYATCNQLWSGLCRRLRIGTVFLWLEPDAIPTRPTSFDEIETDFMDSLALNHDLCVFGHDKSDQLPTFKFVSGVAVYRVTETLLSAIRSISHHKPHDMELGRELYGTSALEDTPKIRCVWGFKDQAYLAGFEKDPARIVQHHRKAAIIHGDREHEIFDLAWGAGGGR